MGLLAYLPFLCALYYDICYNLGKINKLGNHVFCVKCNIPRKQKIEILQRID